MFRDSNLARKSREAFDRARVLRAYLSYRKRCRKTRAKIQTLRNVHRGKTLFCVGNGPSLGHQDLRPFRKFPTILTNFACQLQEEIGFSHPYNVVTDRFRLGQLHEKLVASRTPTFTGLCSFEDYETDVGHLHPSFMCLMTAQSWSYSCYVPRPTVEHGVGFSEDICEQVFPGYSVIFSAIQIAAYMGAQKIVCLGIEMDYTGDSPYFRGGIAPVMQIFDYEIHARPMFQHIREALEQRGVELLNATPGGKVQELRHIKLPELLPGNLPGAVVLN